MTERSYPFVDGATTDAEFSAMFRQVFPNSVLGAYGSTALSLTADSSGMRVTLQPGNGFVRGHFYRNQDPLALTIGQNTSGQARIDTVVLRLQYGTVKAIKAVVVPGAPGGGAPALTQTDTGTYDLPLWNIKVAAGAPTIGPADLVDRRAWWGLELLRVAGVAVGPTAPAPGDAFLHIKTA